jgi:hypothetical protein
VHAVCTTKGTKLNVLPGFVPFEPQRRNDTKAGLITAENAEGAEILLSRFLPAQYAAQLRLLALCSMFF